MELKVKRIYKDRSGDLWHVVYVDAPGSHPVIAHAVKLTGLTHVAVNTFRTDGTCSINKDETSPVDLVAEFAGVLP